MFKKCKLKTLLVTVLAVVFSISMFATTAEAKAPVVNSNAAPIITNGDPASIEMNQGESSKSILLNATDSNTTDRLTWSVSQKATYGNVTISTSNRSGRQANCTYLPLSTAYTGSDRFVVLVRDGKGGSDTITINVAINPIGDPPVIQTINYVALGDSIATGTIYPGASITTYVTYFYQYLQSLPNSNVTMKNFAADGARTNELFNKLGLGTDTTLIDATMINAIKEATVITISIGGNNLMQAAKDSSSLGGYNFSHVDTTVAEQGVADFYAQWASIVSKIKEYNGNAKIYVNTIYNPYNEGDTYLHGLVDDYLFRAGTGINNVISNNAGTLNYKVVDVFNAFNTYKNNMGAITYFYPGPLDLWGQLTRNPHPNATGQNIITNTLKSVYMN